MRITTWNCRRASESSLAWNYFRKTDPDLALLQEIVSLPPDIKASYEICRRPATEKDLTKQRFGSAVLVKGSICQELDLKSPYAWVNEELLNFRGNVLALAVTPRGGQRLNVINIHSPAWPIPKERWRGKDVGDVKLIQNPDIWVSDLLWSCIQAGTLNTSEPWVIAGDFNLSETFDAWKGGPRGNRECLDKMASLGLTECLRLASGKLTPTYRSPGGSFTAQMDHLFVSAHLVDQLVSCVPGDPKAIFGERVSDHLPIIADFRVNS